ncbi:MAG: hypothetical protein F4Y92_07335 [Dehalococcoidia bacterium]|nr:hypothetical protein [Dehalococcoidia bacterium]
MVTRDVSEDLREREEAMATWRWWEEHHEELLKRYPEQYVVINKERQVIASFHCLRDLSKAIEEEGLVFGKDIDTEFITDGRHLRL